MLRLDDVALEQYVCRFGRNRFTRLDVIAGMAVANRPDASGILIRGERKPLERFDEREPSRVGLRNGYDFLVIVIVVPDSCTSIVPTSGIARLYDAAAIGSVTGDPASKAASLGA